MSVITDMAGDPILDMAGSAIQDMAGGIVSATPDYVLTVKDGIPHYRRLEADEGETIIIDLQFQDASGTGSSIEGSFVEMRFSRIYGADSADATVDLSQASSGIARCVFAAGDVAPDGLWLLSARITSAGSAQQHRLAEFTVQKSAY